MIKVPQRVLNTVPGSTAEDWRQHSNGGGWIYKTATVAESAYLHPTSIVFGDGASIGNGASIGDEAKIGNWASIGDEAKIGNGASIGNWAKIGNGARIGEKTSWSTNPPQIQGTRHLVTLYSLDCIAIGCHVHPIAEWQEKYKVIGRAEGYTKEQIEEYGEHINYLASIATKLRAAALEKQEAA